MKRTDLEKINISTLVSIIVYGANPLGLQLTKLLSQQGSRVIVIDSYTKDTKPIVQEIKKTPGVDFVDFQGIEDLFNTLKRFDYCFYLQSEFLKSQKQYRSKDFLKESNTLNLVLKGSSKYNAKMSLVSSLELNRSLVEALSSASPSQPSPYSPEEIQKYAETVTAEFHDKSNLNARILRVGTTLGAQGRNMDDIALDKLLESAVEKNQIEIEGDGLDTHYIIDFEDAVYGILRMTFKKDTDGEVITLANSKEYTTLAIAYKLLELNPTAQTIRFIPPQENEPMLMSQYVPATFADKYGWSPNISLEEAVTKELSLRFEESKKHWDEQPIIPDNTLSQNSTAKTTKTDKKTNNKKQLKNKTGKKIDFKSSFLSSKDKKVSPSKVKTGYQTQKTLLGRFLDTLLSPFKKVTSKIIKSKSQKSETTQADRIKLSVITVTLLLLFYFLIGPVINLGIGGFLINNEIKSAYQNILDFNFEKADPHFQKIQTYYDRTESSFKRISWIFTITGQKDFYGSLSQIYYGIGYGTDGARDMISALQPLADYAKEFEPAISIDDTTPQTTKQYREQLNQLRENRALLASATYKIGLASNVIDGLETKTFPQKLQPTVADVKEYNRDLSQLLEPFQNTVSFLPELLGVDSRQRYLILLQNPSELRSTGGWLSSYAILGVESGQIMQLDVDDIYNIEGLLSVQGKEYTAPEDMQNALGIENWSFSLVNWEPDLSNVIEDSEMFVQDSGRALAIDGIITIDVDVVRSLLDTWGGVTVAGEPEKITSENLYDKIFDIHKDFTPGSRQKTTFLANLANEVLRRVFASDAGQYAELSQTIYQSLNEKHILAYIRNPLANSYLAQEGWNGSIEQTHLATPVPIEWNWGANKANLYLERTQDVEMVIHDGTSIDYTYDLAIKNNSKEDIYPQGDYENYMRIYLPESAQITAASGFKDNQYEIYLKDGYKVIGGWFNVPIQKIKKLHLEYILNDGDELAQFPIKVLGNNIYLKGKVFKQPGLNNDPYTLSITYPDTWAARNYDGFEKGLSYITKSFDLNEDFEFEVNWEFK